MSRTTLPKLARYLNRQIAAPRASLSLRPATKAPKLLRPFTTSKSLPKGLSPSSSDPPPPKNLEETSGAAGPAELSIEEYNGLSDAYLDSLVSKLEELAEKDEKIDVEFSAGVLTLTFPPAGTYVLNKQPPNKQIWLSSPITGPKRYDFVMASEGQDAKEGTGKGEWVYLRDGSTLSELLRGELGISMGEGS